MTYSNNVKKILEPLGNLVVKCFIYFLVTISLLPIMIVEGGNAVQNLPQDLLRDIIETFNHEELDEFNERVRPQNSTIYQRILLAIVINAGIFIIIRYGYDLIHNTWDFIRDLPGNISNATQMLFENTRDLALRSIANATPEERLRMLEIARTIIDNRTNGQLPPPVA